MRDLPNCPLKKVLKERPPARAEVGEVTISRCLGGPSLALKFLRACQQGHLCGLTILRPKGSAVSTANVTHSAGKEAYLSWGHRFRWLKGLFGLWSQILSLFYLGDLV